MKEQKIMGKNIVRLKKLKKWTQEDLCGHCKDMDRSFLSELDNGKMNVTINKLSVIAEALGVDLVELVSEG